MDRNELLEKYRAMFKKEFDELTESNGHNLGEAWFILDSALDLAYTDKINEDYK